MKAAQTPFTVSSATSGAYLTLAFIPSWSEGITAGRGRISVALVIFAGYQPIHIAIGALLFGCVSALSYVGQAQNWAAPSAILSYVALYRNIGRHDDSQTILEKYARLGCGASGAGNRLFPRSAITCASDDDDHFSGRLVSAFSASGRQPLMISPTTVCTAFS
jgi:hypothetical protein